MIRLYGVRTVCLSLSKGFDKLNPNGKKLNLNGYKLNPGRNKL